MIYHAKNRTNFLFLLDINSVDKLILAISAIFYPSDVCCNLHPDNGVFSRSAPDVQHLQKKRYHGLKSFPSGPTHPFMRMTFPYGRLSMVCITAKQPLASS